MVLGQSGGRSKLRLLQNLRWVLNPLPVPEKDGETKRQSSTFKEDRRSPRREWTELRDTLRHGNLLQDWQLRVFLAKTSSRRLNRSPGNSSWNGMGWEEPAAGWPVLWLCQDQPGHRGGRWGGCPWCPHIGFPLLCSHLLRSEGGMGVRWTPPHCSHTHLGVRAKPDAGAACR